jgi:hypothetical protein
MDTTFTLISYAGSGVVFWSSDENEGLLGPHRPITLREAEEMVRDEIPYRNIEVSVSLRRSRTDPAELIIEF